MFSGIFIPYREKRSWAGNLFTGIIGKYHLGAALRKEIQL